MKKTLLVVIALISLFCNAAMAQNLDTTKGTTVVVKKEKKYVDLQNMDALRPKPVLVIPNSDTTFWDKMPVTNTRAAKISDQVNQLADLVNDFTKGKTITFGYYTVSTDGYGTITIIENLNGMSINKYVITAGANPIIDCYTSKKEWCTYNGGANPKPIFIGNKGFISIDNLNNLQSKIIQLSKIFCQKINPDNKLTCMK